MAVVRNLQHVAARLLEDEGGLERLSGKEIHAPHDVSFWLMPIRMGGKLGTPRTMAVEAKTEEEAKNYIRGFPEYRDNFYKLPIENRSKIGFGMVIELEEDENYFFSRLRRMPHLAEMPRKPEKILKCRYQQHSDLYKISCRGVKAADDTCVLQRPRRRSDLPRACPYLKSISEYAKICDDGST